MRPNSGVVARLTEHGLNIVFPREENIERLHTIIVDELANNIFTEEAKELYITCMNHIYDDHQVEGIILGCTGKFNYMF